MHQPAVICLCALTGFFLWRDVLELFIAYYSGVEQSIATRIKVWIALRSVIGVAAIVTALMSF